MGLIRPIAPEDLDALVALVRSASFGLTSLPPDRALLEEKILDSCDSFRREKTKPGSETYLFALEDVDKKTLAGVSAIHAKVGGFEPYYTYRIEKSAVKSKVLGIEREIEVLHLEAEHSGPTEIGGLFLAPAYRRGGNGRLLSLARFLFIAEFIEAFETGIIAEMRGIVGPDGECPFWNAIGKHFFGIPFPRADYLTAKDKRFIAELMPIHPIYKALLPADAQATMGQVHENTRPALRMLEEEGFAFAGKIDIFEGGPIVHCATKKIRTIRESLHCEVGEVAETGAGHEDFLLSNTRRDFRACKASVEMLPGGKVRIPPAAAAALQAGPGDGVRFAPLGPGKKSETQISQRQISQRKEALP